MWIIEFYLLDRTDNEFKKVYLQRWQGDVPMFTPWKSRAKRYWHEAIATENADKLEKAKSKQAITLNIEVVKC